ncbi:hypothetical protein Tco_0002885 [Tanacetum coccineum]
MGSLDQTLTVMLNDLVYSIRIFEEQFHSDSLLPSPISNNTFDDGESTFKEEFIGPSMVVYGEEGDGFHGGDGSLPKETDKSFLGMSPRNLHRESVDDSPKDHSNSNSNIDKKHSLSPHDKYGGSVGTDIKEMDKIKAKTDKHEHGNGMSAQEPGVSSKKNPYVIPDVKGNDTLAIPCILIGGINVAGNGRLRSKWYEGSYGSKAMIR